VRDCDQLPGETFLLGALDQLAPDMTRFLAAVEDRLRASGAARVINSTNDTLTRLPLIEELHRRGLNPFRAVRVGDERARELRFPVFIREEHGHGGALTPALRSPRELAAALRRLVWTGWRRDSLLVVEFCDTADSVGHYHKYAAFIVGDRIIPRSLSIGPGWMLKHRSGQFTRAGLEAEREYVEQNPHEEELRSIARIARVEWGRADYAVRDGAVVIWEINLNPTIGRGRRPPSGAIPDALRPLRDAARERFDRDFAAAFQAIDSPATDRTIALPDASVVTRPAEVLRPAALGEPRLWLRMGRRVRSFVHANRRSRA
jgi:hypothetical protein